MRSREIFYPERKRNILVVGDIMLDSYVSGDVERISPEAPVPVLVLKGKKSVLGGAGNVARNLSVWNAHTTIVGKIGDDDEGAEVRSLMSSFGVSIPDFCVDSACSTISKIRVIAANQHVCRIDTEGTKTSYAPSAETSARILENVAEADAVVVSDYAKGFVTETLLQKIIDVCNSLGKVLCIDPKPKSKLNFRNPFLLKPNRKEALELAEIEPDRFASFPAEKVCSRIYEKFAPQNLVITMGGDGLILSSRGRVVKSLAAEKVGVFDVSGAGDTVVSMLAFALSAGLTLDGAASLALRAAAVVVGKFGTSHAEISEILQN